MIPAGLMPFEIHAGEIVLPWQANWNIRQKMEQIVALTETPVLSAKLYNSTGNGERKPRHLAGEVEPKTLNTLLCEKAKLTLNQDGDLTSYAVACHKIADELDLLAAKYEGLL